jgi:hypothetical protein
MVSAASPADPNLPIQQTDASGRTRLILAETVLDAGGSRPAGIYEVTAEWGGHVAQSSIEMKGHSRLELQFEGLVVAEGATLPALAGIAGLLLLAGRRRSSVLVGAMP